MEEIKRADKSKAEENRRNDKVTALECDEKVEQIVEEQAYTAETKAKAIQESNLKIMLKMLMLQAEMNKQFTDCQEKNEAKEAQKELIRQKKVEEQMKYEEQNQNMKEQEVEKQRK